VSPTANHVLVWSDEFDAAGCPDPLKWEYETGPKLRNNEVGHYTKRIENVRVQNGNLVIEARREKFEGSAYTSGSVTTRTTFPFVYGRVEIRAKLPRGRGIWPALWLLGWHNEKAWWPETGEIDLMEHVGVQPDLLYFTIHTLDNNHGKKNPIQASLPVPALYDDYHVYRMDWAEKSVTLFVDDRQVLTHAKTSDKMASWPFANPMYLIMNVAVGGDWGGMKGIDDTIFPQRLLVDYVRIYKAKP
jgi:beta-glucanase (GH16 family)